MMFHDYSCVVIDCLMYVYGVFMMFDVFVTMVSCFSRVFIDLLLVVL